METFRHFPRLIPKLLSLTSQSVNKCGKILYFLWKNSTFSGKTFQVGTVPYAFWGFSNLHLGVRFQYWPIVRIQSIHIYKISFSNSNKIKSEMKINETSLNLLFSILNLTHFTAIAHLSLLLFCTVTVCVGKGILS